jgi:hypothetical protein
VLDVLMARALAKDPALRPSTAIELGEAFRAALGLEDSAGWSAQRELAELARTISGLDLPAVPPTLPNTDPDPEGGRAGELRRDVVSAFSTQPLPEQPAQSADPERR